jgi:hypothetical protein
MQFLPRIKQSTDAVVNITTGGAPGFSEEDRLAAPLRASPEMTSLNMGSMNFGFWPLADKFDWKHEWERELMMGSKRFPANHNFALIERIMRELGEGHGTRFEYECYDIGHLYSVKHFADAGLIKPPFLIQGIFGILGGIGAELENFMMMKQTADRLFGEDYIMSCFAVGGRRCASWRNARSSAGAFGSAGRQPLCRPRPAGEEQCRAGAEGAHHPGGARHRDRDPCRGAGDARPQGRRRRRLLKAKTRCVSQPIPAAPSPTSSSRRMTARSRSTRRRPCLRIRLPASRCMGIAAEARSLTVAELLGRASTFIHGTTHALNAIITARTARTALIVTRGHRDILLFREGGRTDPFDHTSPIQRRTCRVR